ncbi:MAG: CPBP family intramembrane metalloprotease [Ruminococcaceae bacterium]|nr:CPBP family intramembrane metalloprotease [Oscillospiraceae bacterium]
MRLFCYYALHTLKNQLKKLFKTWVLIFLLACMLIGGLIGLGAAKLSDMADDGEPEPGQVDILPGDADEPGDGEEPEELIPEDDVRLDEFGRQIVELIAGAVILGVLVFEVMGADKNGSKIFLPADVSLLFAAPLRPQSVLMFRLMTQLGMAILASIYLLFQLPNLMLNVGMGLWAALAVIVAWCFTVAIGKLIQTLLYTFCSTHAGLKKYIRYAVYALGLALAAAYVLQWRQSGSYFTAAVELFNRPASRYIPVWGWLKGIVAFAMEGSLTGTLLCIGACLVTGAALLLVIRRVQADFYEDAMAKSEEMAELLERAQSEKASGIVFKKRKKDRSDSLRRDRMNHGAGANVFFFKSLYNRFRFAHLGVFTKTAETYLAAAVGVALLCRLVFQTRSLIPAALALAVLAFYRTLGNPLEQDTKMDCFCMVPESTWAKLFWSLMGGTANCLLDLLPAMLAAMLILGADPLEALGWLLLVVSVDFYATNEGTFINLSVPVSAGKTIKQVVQVMFLYFGLLPDIAVMAIALVTGHPVAGILGCVVVNAALGLVFFFLSPLFLTPGAGRAAPAAALDADGRQQAKRAFSRLGLSAALILVVGTAVQLGLALLLNAVAPGWGSAAWGTWLVTFAPLYLVAVPVGLLVARDVPASPPEKSSMGAGRYLSVILISVFMMFAGNLLGTLIQSFVESVTGTLPVNPIEAYAMDDSLVLRVLFLVILAPLIEEFIFRRTLIDRMRPYGEKLAVVTSAVMFGLFHGNLSQMFYAFLLGLVLGYVYLRTGRLRYSVGLHMLINLFGGVISVELLQRALPDLESLDQLAADLTQLAGLDRLPDLSALITPGLILFGIYALVTLGCVVAGLVLLCVRARRVVFRPAPLELARRQQFAAVYGNVGMILFVLVCLISVAGTYL